MACVRWRSDTALSGLMHFLFQPPQIWGNPLTTVKADVETKCVLARSWTNAIVRKVWCVFLSCILSLLAFVSDWRPLNHTVRDKCISPYMRPLLLKHSVCDCLKRHAKDAKYLQRCLLLNWHCNLMGHVYNVSKLVWEIHWGMLPSAIHIYMVWTYMVCIYIYARCTNLRL